jgi:cytosine/adenosine deaminase-related metal-dependent hydrolase
MMVTREACFTPRLPEQGEMGVETCKTLGPEQAISRITALKMTTQWAAYYMLKENQIGSLEVGKWADFVVIDKDYFAVSGKGIQDINVLLTVIGGKVAYASPDYGPIDRALFKGPEYVREAQLSN